MRKDSISLPATAGVLLVTAFAVLCMAIFSVIVVSTQRGYSASSGAAAAAAAAYYAADAAAERTVAALRRGDSPAGVTRTGDICRFTVPIDDTRQLAVCVRLAGGAVTVLGWQVQTTTVWQNDTSLPVWDGNSI